MAAEYEEILRKIQEGLAQKLDVESEGGGRGRGGGGGGGGGGGRGPQCPQVLPPPPAAQPQPQPQPQLPSSPSFKQLYDHICQRIRSTGSLDTIMTEFQELKTDQERVEYVLEMNELQTLDLEENYAGKSESDATNYEKVYDMLITNEASANKALEIMQKCLQKTPSADTTSLAVRYMKRGWASLLLEHFDDAETDAKTSLSLQCTEDVLWNSHEILGHCYARLQDCKAAENHFHKALENLRKSNASNEVKATATMRIMTVFKTVKAKKGKRVKAQENEAKSLPQVSYGRHKTFVSASSALEFLMTEDRGRCAIAKRDIKPGDILIVDKPFCSMIHPDFLGTNCYHCYARCTTPFPCLSCATVNYCSVGCREESWERGAHQGECTVFNHITHPDIGKLAILSYRVVTTVTWAGLQRWRGYIDDLVAKEAQQAMEEKENQKHEELQNDVTLDTDEVHNREQGELEKERLAESHRKPNGIPLPWEGKFHPRDYKTVLHMASNSTKRSFGDLFKRSITAVYLVHCLRISGFFGSRDVSKENLIFAASLLLRHLQASSCNAYEIGEMKISDSGPHIGQMQEIGGALYTTISLTNHSCVSNASRYSVGNKCILRAVRPISQGTEVCDNYGFFYHSSTVNERRDVLLNQYKFSCVCQACKHMWPLYPHHPHETLIFRCPYQGCKRPCCYSTSCRSRCNVCGNKQQYAKLLQDIEQQMKLYKTSLDQMVKGNISAALPSLITHMTFMERHCVEPVKHFTDAQEAIKQCFNHQGNISLPRQAVQLAQAQTRAAPKLKAAKKEVIVPS